MAQGRLNQLRKIVQEVHESRDLAAALALIVDRVTQFLDVDCCSIFLCDSSNETNNLVATKGFALDLVGKVCIPFGKGLIGFIVEQGHTLNLKNPEKDPRFFAVPETGENRYASFLGIPIIHQRKAIGVMALYQVAERHFDEASVAFAMTLCVQLAPLIAHAEISGDLPAYCRIAMRSEANYTGLPGSPGIAIGQAVFIIPDLDFDAIPDKYSKKTSKELREFRTALKNARDEVHQLSKQLGNRLSAEEALLFEAYIQILDGENLGKEVEVLIEAGMTAPTALKEVIKRHVKIFEDMEDAYLRERASDIKDLGRRVLTHLLSWQRKKIEYPEQFVLVGEELTASLLAEVPVDGLVGLISVRGSVSSHVAILARSLGIPAVVGVHRLKSAIDGETVILDGYKGEIFIAPSPALKRQYQKRIVEEADFNKILREMRELRAETPDGKHIPLCVNTGLVADISPSLEVGAEGVGLYRTEVPFMVRDCFPTEEEQYRIYRELLACFMPRPVTIRTLDIGGDKALPYFPIREENPFLGWRGIRITLDHPEIFNVQIRAMLRASAGFHNLRVMLPMISNVGEIREAKRHIYAALQVLQEQGLDVGLPEIGAMIEVPAAVYMIDSIVDEVDFLSVGSNDLIQYLLAVDRNNGRVAYLYEALHPAVLIALKRIVESAHRKGKKISICGEMASDPIAVILLIGLGFDELSMNATSLPKAKWIIRNFTLKKAEALVNEVLTMENPQEIRSLLEQTLIDAGMQVLLHGQRFQ